MSRKVVHFEIPADDVERAGAFYEKAFGWRLATAPGMGYTIVGTTPTDERGASTEPGAINGGMLERQAPISNVVITVDVDDVDEALRKIEELGGSVVRGKLPEARQFSSPGTRGGAATPARRSPCWDVTHANIAVYPSCSV